MDYDRVSIDLVISTMCFLNELLLMDHVILSSDYRVTMCMHLAHTEALEL